MQTLRLSLLAAGMLALSSGLAQAQHTNIVRVGSSDIILFPPGAAGDTNFSLIAIKDAAGNVSGQWTDHFNNLSGIHVTVSCLEVAGNQAWIGGTITGVSPDMLAVLGLPCVTSCVDAGQTPNGPPDLLSFSFIGAAISNCTNRNPNFPLNPINNGQVRVQ